MAEYIGEDEFDLNEYLSQLKFEPTTEDNLEDDNISDEQLKELKTILNKMFELVGCEETVDEIMELSEYEQTLFWNKYKLTEEQYKEWYEYFLENCDSLIDNCSTDDEINEIFNIITDQWAFEIQFSQETLNESFENTENY